jgi:hypothetical protein
MRFPQPLTAALGGLASEIRKRQRSGSPALALVGKLTALASSWVIEVGLVEPSELTPFRVWQAKEKRVSPGGRL